MSLISQKEITRDGENMVLRCPMCLQKRATFWPQSIQKKSKARRHWLARRIKKIVKCQRTRPSGQKEEELILPPSADGRIR